MAIIPVAVFESFDPHRRVWSYVLDRPQAVHFARNLSEVLLLLEEADQVVQKGLWAVLMVSYEAAPAFDTAMEVHASDGFPLAWLAVFREPCSTWRACDLPTEGVASPTWSPLIAHEAYETGISTIRSGIARGDCYQVNYTFPFECWFQGDVWAWYRSLGAAQGAGYSAWLDLGRYRVLSFSPELFFERQGNVLRARPMKGTVPRGRWAAEDEERRKELEESTKNRAENLMIVDLLRNDLGRVSLPGTVQVPRLFEVERYATLFQMTSTVESICPPDTGLGDLFGALFPCGSVTGAPKIAAMAMIRSLELTPRGAYTGAIGLIRPGGDFTFNVAIRTLVLDQETGRAVFGVGGGITYDSSAEDEYAECLTKMRFLTTSTSTFELIETLRLEAGVYFLLDRHVTRMLDSARFFDFLLDEASIRTALEGTRLEHQQGTWRVRLLATRDGAIHSDLAPLLEPLSRVRRVAFGPKPLDSHSPFLCHKTTHRYFYEQPLRERTDCDDLIFWNERGEVTESSIANVVVELDGQKWTPSRVSGLLAGTFRAELLALGEIRERVVFKEELERAHRLFLINSVQGWMPAEWAVEKHPPSAYTDPGLGPE